MVKMRAHEFAHLSVSTLVSVESNPTIFGIGGGFGEKNDFDTQ